MVDAGASRGRSAITIIPGPIAIISEHTCIHCKFTYMCMHSVVH